MYSHKPLVLVLAYAFSSVAWAQGVEEPNVQQLQDLVVMVAPTHEPNTVCLNPKSAFQPMPATDGAGLLKAIPNMGIIRKGGMSGEPLFRGLGGSRLGIYSNDSQFFGGCPGRMDPPTAYIFPQTYDEVILTKGPQTVVAGPGQIAGSVQFSLIVSHTILMSRALRLTVVSRSVVLTVLMAMPPLRLVCLGGISTPTRHATPPEIIKTVMVTAYTRPISVIPNNLLWVSRPILIV